MCCEIKYIGTTESTNVLLQQQVTIKKCPKKIITLKKAFLYSSCSELLIKNI